MKTKLAVSLAVCGIIAAILVLSACSSYSAPSTTAATTPTKTTPATSTTSKPVTAANGITINLTAKNFAFDKTTITVPAGAAVTVNFSNQDSGIPHNFSVYQTLAGGQTKAVFVGNTITGPGTTTYQFSAPSAAGDYFFECDVHPTQMNGKFIISP